MIKKKLEKKCLLLFSFLLCFSVFNAQVGIGTNDPKGVLHIDSKSNNATPSATVNDDDLIITNDGKVGIGTINPTTKVDLRNSSLKGIFAIGPTDQIATNAGAGALQYVNDGGGKLVFSDGTKWSEITASPKKIYIKAYKNSAQTFAANTSSSLANWTETDGSIEYRLVNNLSSLNYFDFTDGSFTAPKSGTYSAFIILGLRTTQLNPGNISINWEVHAKNSQNIYERISSETCIRETTNSGTVSAGFDHGISCTIQVLLEKDQKIKVVFQNNSGSANNLIANDIPTKVYYNAMSILEQ